jgi:hypothetical protein
MRVFFRNEGDCLSNERFFTRHPDSTSMPVPVLM